MFPRKVLAETTIDEESGRIKVQRDIGCEYVNSWNRPVMSVLPMNHDVRSLMSVSWDRNDNGDIVGVSLAAGVDELYYTIKYSTKDQQTVENAAVLVAAFERRAARDAATAATAPASDEHAARRRVCSMLYALTKTHEVATPLAAHYLLGKRAVYVSNKFAPLLLSQSLAALARQEIEAEVVERQRDDYVIVSQLVDYTCRPAALEHVSHYVFIECYEKVRWRRNNGGGGGVGDDGDDGDDNVDGVDDAELRFASEHPQADTHVLRLRRHAVVVDVIGPRLPDRRTFINDDDDGGGSVSDAAKADKFAEIALLLFKPYRTLTGVGGLFAGEPMTPHGEYEAWRSRLDAAATRSYCDSVALAFVANGQAYHDAKQRARESTDRNAAEMRELFGNGNAVEFDSDDDEAAPAARRRRQEEYDDADVGNEIGDIAHLLDGDAYIRGAPDERLLGPLNDVAPILSTIAFGAPRRDGNGAGMMMRVQVDVSALENSIDEAERRCRADPEDNDDDDGSNDASIVSTVRGSGGGGRVTVELLEAALGQRRWPRRRQSTATAAAVDDRPPSFMSIEQASARAILNERQHMVFSIVARKLLQDFADGLQQREPTLPQLLLLLHGLGGTGKSRVISTLVDLSTSWRRTAAVVKLAPTGIAAVNIDGTTIHSGLAIPVKRRKRRRAADDDASTERTRATEAELDRWAPVRLAIIDETSMIDKRLLCEINVSLQRLKETDDPFGGVSVVLAGDFYQLPPVASTPLYVAPRTSVSFADLEIAGWALYHMFDTVVLLTENMRAFEDATFADFLKHLRRGTMRSQDRRLIESMALNEDAAAHIDDALASSSTADLPRRCPVLVSSNTMRRTLTWRIVKQLALPTTPLPTDDDGLAQPPVVVVPAAFYPSSRGRSLDEATRRSLFAQDEIEKMMPWLPLSNMMPVMVTHNVSVPLGIANGTVGFVVGIQFAPDTTFEPCTVVRGSTAQVQRASQPIECLFVRVPRARFTGPDAGRLPGVPSEFPEDTFPLLPLHVAGAQVKLPNRSFTVSMTQVPVLPAYVITVHKSQAQTLDAAVIGALRGVGAIRSPPRTSLYVAASRVRTSRRLVFSWRPTEQDLAYFVPPRSLVAEMQRLDELASRTEQRELQGLEHGAVIAAQRSTG